MSYKVASNVTMPCMNRNTTLEHFLCKKQTTTKGVWWKDYNQTRLTQTAKEIVRSMLNEFVSLNQLKTNSIQHGDSFHLVVTPASLYISI